MCSAEQQARWRAKCRKAGRCVQCGRGRLPGCLQCEVCLAFRTEARLSDLVHDTKLHARYLYRSHNGGRCAVTGLSRVELEAMGDRLTVDRIDPDMGYVRGNMQLLSGYLNRVKWRHLAPPSWAVERVRALARGEQVRDF